MDKYQNLMSEYGPIAALIDMSADFVTGRPVALSSPSHLAVAGTWTCDVVVPNYSTFCDNIWPLWDLDWVHNSIYISSVFTWIFSWMLFFGTIVSIRKDAFENP